MRWQYSKAKVPFYMLMLRALTPALPSGWKGYIHLVAAYGALILLMSIPALRFVAGIWIVVMVAKTVKFDRTHRLGLKRTKCCSRCGKS